MARNIFFILTHPAFINLLQAVSPESIVQFIPRNLKNNLFPILLRMFALMLLLGMVLGQVPAQNAHAAGETLSLTKTIDGNIANAKVGDTILYRIHFACSSLTTDCGQLEIKDTLPVHPGNGTPLFTYVAADSQVSGTGGSVYSISESGGVVTITSNNFLDGSQADAVIALKVRYDVRTLPVTFKNTASGRIWPADASAWSAPVLADSPNLTIDGIAVDWNLTKSLYSPSINPTVDTDVTYRLQLCPGGASGNVALTGVTMTDTLPAGAVFVSASNGGTYAGGVVSWTVTGTFTPPSCATRYVTIRYPSTTFESSSLPDTGLISSVTNTAGATADYTPSSGTCTSPCFSDSHSITHPIVDIVEVPTYSKGDAGDPVGSTGTARFILNLHTNGTNYPPNAVTLIDNLLPGAGALQVTEVTSGTWSSSFNNVRAYVEYSTNDGSTWTAFPSQPASYNTNATYTAPAANITNVRWRFEYDADPDGDGTFTTYQGLPYDWSFSVRPEIRVRPRAVATTADAPSGAAMPAAVSGATYNNCLRVSRINSSGNPVLGSCANQDMTVQGNYVSLRTYKTETPGIAYDPNESVASQIGANFKADTTIMPNDLIHYVITVEVTERSSANLVNPTIQDTLPPELVFVQQGTAKLDGSDLPAAQQPAFNYDSGTGKLTWAWNNPSPSLTVPPVALPALGSKYLTVDFYARIPPGTPDSTYSNGLYVVTDSVDARCEVGTTEQDSTNADVDLDADATDPACRNNDTFKVERAAALRGEKWIRSVNVDNNKVALASTLAEENFTTDTPAGTCPDGGTIGLAGSSNHFTRYPCVSQAFPESALSASQHVPPPSSATLDDFEYNLRIFNEGNVPMLKYVLYDILPYYGDTGSGGALAYTARASQFRPVLRGPIEFLQGVGIVGLATVPLTSADFTIEYNDTTNPCRPEVFDKPAGASYPAGCSNVWTNNWATARSYRIRLNNNATVLTPNIAPYAAAGTELRFGVPMYIPWDSPALNVFNQDDPQTREIAWNSFSHVGSYDKDAAADIQNEDLLASEPRKVGITIPERFSIGNRVWRDSDNSGTINAPDDANPGIANVTVNLYPASNTTTPIATATTDSGGYYLFSNLPAGDYIVGIPASNFNDTTDPLYNLRSSTGTPANAAYTNPPETNPDSEDHGVDPLPLTIPSAEVFSPIIPLSHEAEEEGESDLSDNDRDGPTGTRRGVNAERDDNSDLTVDFGFFGGSNIPFSIGNHLWKDDGTGGGTINNGIREAGESPVIGARVELYRDGNLDGITPPSEMIRWDTTDAGGFYLFDNLDPGNYYVLVHPDNFISGAPLEGWYSSQFPTPANAEANIDNNDDGVDNDAPEVQGVRSSVVVLTRGTPEPINETYLSSDISMAPGFNPTAGDGTGHIGRFGEANDTSNMTVDFGFIPPMSLGNRVWIDETVGTPTGYNNGLMDGTEAGKSGVLVQLWLDTDTTPGLNVATDTLLDDATTDASGYYLFEHLQPGTNYYVHIPASNFTGGALVNYLSSYDANQTPPPADDTQDMDDNGLDNSNTPATDGVTSPVIAMAYGTEPQTPANETDISPDTAAYGTGNVGLIPGQTDRNSNLTIDFGFVSPPRSIGNRLWFDDGNGTPANLNNGVLNPGELPVVGARVSLYRDTDGDGQPDDLGATDWLAWDTTDANGYYLFDNLPAGRYLVGVDTVNFSSGILAEYTSSTGNANNSATNTDSLDNGVDRILPGDAAASPYGVLSTNINLTAIPLSGLPTLETVSGDTVTTLGNNPTAGDGAASIGRYGETDTSSDLTIDFGFFKPMSLGNRVFHDDGAGANLNNGVMDAGELPFAGVRVELYRDTNNNSALNIGSGDTFINFDITDINGYYLFDRLTPGNYFVYIPSGNFAASFDPDGAGSLPAAQGALRGWYNSVPTFATDVDINDNGVNNAHPQINGIASGMVALGWDSEPAGETELSGNTTNPNDATSDDFDPTRWDGLNSRGRWNESDDNSNLTIDFGFIPPLSLGNRVWLDEGTTAAGFDLALFNNGLMDGTEVGRSGVVLNLYYSSNDADFVDTVDGVSEAAIYRTVTTDATGFYLFDGLPLGNFYVRVAPSNFNSGNALYRYQSSTGVFDNETADVNDNGRDVTNYLTAGIRSMNFVLNYGSEPIAEANLPASTPANQTAYGPNMWGRFGEVDNSSNLTLDFGFMKPHSIGNRVWRDSDNSGTINAPDNANPGIAGVTVDLYADADTTDAGNDGIPDNLTILASTITDADGFYLFDNLPAGNYVIGIPASNFDNIADPLYTLRSSTGTPSILTYTKPTETNPDLNDHGIDSTAVPPTPSTAVYSPIIPLAENEPTAESLPANTPLNLAAYGPNLRGLFGEPDGSSDLTVDFGFFGGSDVPFSIGNHLWKDNGYDDGLGAGAGILNDGIRQDDEPAVVGARVELYRDGNLDGITPPSELIRWDTTDAGGFYLFDNLDPGNYYVLVHPSNFVLGGPLAGWYSSQLPLPANTEANIDNNDDGVDNSTPEVQGVRSSVVILARGTPEPINESYLSSDVSMAAGFNPTAGDGTGHIGRFGEANDTSNVTVDFGFIPPMSLGNRVWFDSGAGESTFRAGYNNGVMDGTEVGVNDVAVELWRDTDATLGLNIATDTLVDTDTTADGGYYLFERIQPGTNYYVRIPTSNFTGAGVLANYISSYDPTQTTVPADDAEDKDDNGIDSAAPATTGINSQRITMDYGTEPQTPANETDISPNTAAYGTGNVGIFLGQTDLNSNLTIDFGFVRPPRSIGNYLWFDTGGGTPANINNGVFDAGEPSVVGARVSLYRDEDATSGTPDGAAIAWDTTDANGYYLFDNLPDGQYLVGVDGDNFDTGGLTGLVGYTSSTGNVANLSNNLDGRDNGVDRLNPTTAGSPYGILSTNINLSAIPLSGLPTGETASGDIVATLGNNPTAGDGAASRGRYGELDANSDLTIDFGFVEAYALGNRVWFDTDNNGLINGSEVGVDGVQVQLYRSSAALPVGTALATTITANGGYYLFDYLAPGDYVVVITADNFDTAGTNNTLVGYWSTGTYRDTLNNGNITETAALDPDNDADASSLAGSDDNGLRQTAAGTFQNAVLSLPVTLGGTGLTEPTNDDDLQPVIGHGNQADGRSNLSVDFGFYRTEIGNLVFEDVNLDGTFNAGDTAISGARVQLFQQNNSTEILIGPDGFPGTGDDASPVLTDASGHYRFGGLPAGDYIVRVTSLPTAGMISTIDTNPQNDNDNPDWYVDSNDNGNGEGPVTVTSDITNLLTMTPGGGTKPNATSKGIIPDNASGTTIDNSVDFGFVSPYSLGNRVWFDTNNSGTMDALEVGVQDVVVDLYAADVSGNPTGLALATDTTTASGFYLFDDLFPRDYVVVIRASNFNAGGPLAGYWSSRTAISGGVATENPANTPDPDTGLVAGPADDDFDIDDNGTRDSNSASAFYKAVISKAVTLGPNGDTEPIGEVAAQLESGVLGNQGHQPDAHANMTVDFGFYKVAIGDLIFLDNDDSGHSNAGDTPIDSVVVKLFNGTDEVQVGPDGILGTVDDAAGGVVTGPLAGVHPAWGAGEYHFSGLPAGDYIVKVTAPNGTDSTIDSNPQNDNDDPDVHQDNNDNGVGQGSATVSANVLTMNGGEAGMFNDATGITTDTSVDFGFVNLVAIGNRVWLDTGAGTSANANNGRLDAGESGVDGVTVQLFSAGPDDVMGGGDDVQVGADTTTSGGGYYKFDNLYPGKYYVKIPADEFNTGGDLIGYVSSVGYGALDDDDDQTVDENGIDGLTRTSLTADSIVTPVYTLTPGLEPSGENQSNYAPGILPDASVNFTADFGFVKLVAIGNRVWYDIGGGAGGTANDGIQNGSEAGASGVTIQLFSPGANGVIGGGDDVQVGADTVTDVNGNYVFDNLVPGSYFVHIPAGMFTGTTPSPASPLAGFLSSTGAGTSPLVDQNADENGIDAPALDTNGINSRIYTLTPNSPALMPTDDDETAYNGYLDDGNVNYTADFGFLNIVAIGNRVWLDSGAGGGTANDGIQNGAEPGVNNVTVELYLNTQTPGADTPVGTTTTNGTGYYVFDNLLAGTYVVHIPAENFAADPDGAGPLTAGLLYGYYSSEDNGADEITDHLGVGGDENGIDQPTPASTGITSTEYALSANSEPTTEDDDTGYLGVLDDDDVNFTADFGFVQKYALGNRVWFDTDDNASMDKGEVGVDGVQVELYLAGTGEEPTGSALATDVTANSGYYLFDNIFPGEYVVVVTADNFTDGGAADTYKKLAGYWSSLTSMDAGGTTTETAAPDPDDDKGNADPTDDDVDKDDNGTRVAITGFADAVISKPVTIGPDGNTEPTDDDDLESGVDHGSQPDERSNLKVDFGFYKVSVGDLVFSDGKRDGTYVSADDAVLSDVIVHLFSTGGIEIPVGADGKLGTSDDGTGGMPTNPGGLYKFDGLPRGDYIITVDSPVGISSTIDNGSPAMQADNDDPNDNLNNNDNGDGITGGPVSSAPVSLIPGVATTNNTVSNSDGSTHNPTVDFGFIPAFSLGNRVWFDTNNNGAFDTTEVGINGIMLEVYAADANSAPTGAVLGTALTHDDGAGNDGYYLFNPLPAGNYVVIITADNFTSGGNLEGYWSSGVTRADNGDIAEASSPDPDDGIANDSDDNGMHRTSDGDVISKPVTLGPNPTEPTNDNDLDLSLTDPDHQGQPDNRGNMTVDFGFYTMSLGNQVWEDVDNSGTINGTEVGFNDVDVELWSADGATMLDSGTTQNDATVGDGFYAFSGLPQGDYLIRIPSTEFEGTGTLVNYTSSTGVNSVTPPVPMGPYEPAPDADTNTNDNDDNGTEKGGTLGAGGYIQSEVISMSPIAEASYDNADGSTSEPRVDFGVFRQDDHDPILGVAKNLVSSTEVSPGTYRVVYDILVSNMGDTPLDNVQVTDDLSATFTAPTTATVASVTATPNLTVNTAYKGTGNLLTGTNSLAINASGTIRLTVTVIPYAAGPFNNTAIGSGKNPFGGEIVDDHSQNGSDPDPDGDDDPTNNDDPTPVDFGPDLFDPPIGIKVFNDAGLPQLEWTMTWINSTNIAAINARVSDPIPAGTTYIAKGSSSGYAVPGAAPAKSTNVGVSCTSPSSATSTTLCYYEGPTTTNPLGRVVWEGTLGPDFGHTNAATAVNELNITFRVDVPTGVNAVHNRATIDTDLNGDGVYDTNELIVADSQSIWVQKGDSDGGDKGDKAWALPTTGFAPNVVTTLPDQPADAAYLETGGIQIEIPKLGVNTSVTGIPQAKDGTWDVTWLWNQAGWLQGTAYPTTTGNSAITGHVYLSNGEPGIFVDIHKLAYGDKIILHAYGQKFTYEVRENKLVRPNEVSVLNREDKAWVTLLTCQGYNEASNTYASRVAVKAVLMQVELEKSASATNK
jgi:LPXTG-site transpeptidase (sortase) family protein